MEAPASVPIYVGAELDPDVGSIPQTPILTRTGSLPTEYVHPLAEVPAEADRDGQGTEVVEQFSTRILQDEKPLKKRESIRLSIEMEKSVKFAALPTALSAASLQSMESRQASDVQSVLDEITDESLSRSHTVCSASTTPINSSDDLSLSPELSKVKTPLIQEEANSRPVTEEQSSSDDITNENVMDNEPSNIVDRMTPPSVLTPVHSLSFPSEARQEPEVSSITEVAKATLLPVNEDDIEESMDHEGDGKEKEIVSDCNPEITADWEESMDKEEDEEGKEKNAECHNPETSANAEEMEVAEDAEPVAADITEASTSGDDTAVLPTPPAPFDPSMRPIDIVFSFDTTGSMSSCVKQVQQQLKEIISRLFMDVPNLKIGIIAHGDYCDAEHFYVSELFNLSNDLDAIANFVSNVSGTGGGDFPECYELVLRRARTEIKWRDWSQRALVMVGDAVPHEVNDNPQNIDWREEVKHLYNNMGVRMYGVQCLASTNKIATPFWEELATSGDGKHLSMDKFSTIIDLIMAVVYREFAPDALVAYEKEVRAREPITSEMSDVFAKLKGTSGDTDVADDTSNVAVPGPSSAITMTSAKTPVWKRTARKMRAMKTPVTTPKKATCPKRVTLNQRTKMQLRPKRFNPPQNLRMSLRSSVTKPQMTLYYLDNTSKAAVVGSRPTTRSKDVPATSTSRRQARVCREITKNHNILRSLDWSPWFLAMKGTMDITTGNTKVSNFETGKHKPAMYEISVETCDASKDSTKPINYHVMYCKITKGVPNGRSWHKYVFSGKDLKDHLANVLAKGCAIYVRRAFLPKTMRTRDDKLVRTVDGMRAAVKDSINYAWLSKNSTTNTCRYVKRGGILISS